MALTSSSTSVAESKRPSSRAPACATFTNAAANIATNSATPACFLFCINEPSNIADSLPQDRGGGRLEFRQNSRSFSVAMMRSVIFGEPFRGKVDFGMQRPHRFQELGSRRNQNRFAFSRVILRDQ